ncbi:MAG: chaperone NapD [Rhodospirillales bacterium]|nr:chaperone NapD [Rhodospirillales bacterium]
MNGSLHISSLVIQARPERLAEVREAIAARGAEIPASDPDGKLVVVLETNSERKITDFLNEVSVMPGVLSANLVFHHNDEHDTAPFDEAAPVSLGGNT